MKVLGIKFEQKSNDYFTSDKLSLYHLGDGLWQVHHLYQPLFTGTGSSPEDAIGCVHRWMNAVLKDFGVNYIG